MIVSLVHHYHFYLIEFYAYLIELRIERMFFFAVRWLSVRLETVGNVVIFFVALLAVFGKDTISPGLAALSITSVLSVRL